MPNFFGYEYKPEAPKPRKGSYTVRTTFDKFVMQIAPEEFTSVERATVAQNSMALLALQEVQREGHMVKPVLLLGGRPAHSVYQARLGEKIVWVETGGPEGVEDSTWFNNALIMADEMLRRKSPFYSGQLRNSYVWINESGATSDTPPLKAKWNFGDTVYVSNRAPYTRKVEELKKAGMYQAGKRKLNMLQIKQAGKYYSIQAPDGVFRVVSKAVRSQFRSYTQSRMLLLRKQYVTLPSSQYGIQTTLKDGRYPALRFVYRGGQGASDVLRKGGGYPRGFGGAKL